MAMDLDAEHKARWQRVSIPSQVDANGLAARAALIEDVTGEQYDVQSLRGLPYEAELCSFELDIGQIHPAGLLWTTLVNGMRVRILVFAIAVGFQGLGLGSQVWGMMREDLRSLGIAKVQLEVHFENCICKHF